MNLKLLNTACIVLSCQASTALAQQAQKHEGAWIGLGLGHGSAHVFCNGCAPSSNQGGFAALFRVGGTLKGGLRLGGEVNFWTKSTDGLWNASLVVYDYLGSRSGVFLKGGAGFAQYHHSRVGRGLNGTGVGFLGGLGYDAPVSRSVFLSPVATVRYGFVGSVDQGLFGSQARRHLVVDITLGVLFH